jgi:hypothetical protein
VPSNDVALGYPTTTPSRCEDKCLGARQFPKL